MVMRFGGWADGNTAVWMNSERDIADKDWRVSMEIVVVFIIMPVWITRSFWDRWKLGMTGSSLG